MNSVESNLKTTEVQDESYSFSDYLHMGRFLSYFYQIKCAMDAKPKTCGVIGIGDGLVPVYLRHQGVQVETIDYNARLKPDHCLSILEDIPAALHKKFDVVLCCQVLEHSEFKNFESALKQIQKMASKRVVISLPDVSKYFSIAGHFPFVFLRSFGFSFPWFKPKNNFVGGHYWEIGKQGYGRNVVEENLRKFFKIEKVFRNPLFPYHTFFILEPLA